MGRPIAAIRGLIVAAVVMTSTRAMSAQAGPVEAVIAGYAVAFPRYVTSDDAHTRPFGGTIAIRLRRPAAPVGFEVAITHAPQASTDQSAAPVLTVVRAGLLLGKASAPARRVAFHATLEPSLLVITPQEIDCGSFPLCSEWSPRELTTVGLAFGAGVEIMLGKRVVLLADGLAHAASASWDPLGRKSLLEVSAGIAIRL